jgi:hypothetical protein
MCAVANVVVVVVIIIIIINKNNNNTRQVFDYSNIVIKRFKARNYYSPGFMVEIRKKNIDILYILVLKIK